MAENMAREETYVPNTITNFGDGNIALPPGEVMLTSLQLAHQGQLAPNATVWLRLT